MARLRYLLTGRTWSENFDGERRPLTDPWSVRWAVAGIHSYKWWWVKKWGSESCGCTINPLTRRRVLYALECQQHEW
ncbi:MAG: hypothetical protein K0U78_03475 [Actinomycetia bacterium]|nr:hypothetical protein [Actinomycetes bacterium]